LIRAENTSVYDGTNSKILFVDEYTGGVKLNTLKPPCGGNVVGPRDNYNGNQRASAL
jgi:hypothetical protein